MWFTDLVFKRVPAYLAYKMKKKSPIITEGFEQKLLKQELERPSYAYLVLNAAKLAQKLGYPRISILEFGVAGGNGLVLLEKYAAEVKNLVGIDIDIYGFDTGEGLPDPADYRDLPYHWQKGFYKMDIPKLQAGLKNARLVIGDIKDTGREFFVKYDPAPIAAISFDLDFYSSTVFALKMLDAEVKYFLPRVYCYFDDICGGETELYNDYTGERLAINEFNQSHTDRKIAMPYHLLTQQTVFRWYHQIRICHFFSHGLYNRFVSKVGQNLPLTKAD